uniref:Uncharacterized protein n=1 Tax=Rhizophora mucronata TaxID=61149 RepID=A0A2P2PV45_RHIMU
MLKADQEREEGSFFPLSLIATNSVPSNHIQQHGSFSFYLSK